MDLLLESDNYGERKGAAYGLAGLVRGLGITALKQLDIMTTLEAAVKDKKNPRRREGREQYDLLIINITILNALMLIYKYVSSTAILIT